MTFRDVTVLPTRPSWAQSHENLAGRLPMDWESGIVLDRDVNIAKMPLQRIAGVQRIGARRTEHQIDHFDGFMHGMRGREAGLYDLLGQIGCLRLLGGP